MKSKTSLRSFLALAGSTLLAISYSHAANIWDGGGGDSNWSTAGNWDNDVVPTTAAINFSGNVQTSTNNTTASLGVTGINFLNDGSTNKTSAFTLAGSSITLGTSNITTTANTTGSTIEDLISLNIALGASRSITTNQLSDTVQHNLKISGIISGISFGITKAGHGTLTLSGANSYTGATSITSGKVLLDMASGGSLNAATTLATSASVFSSGTFEVRGATTGSSAQTMGAVTLVNNSFLKIAVDPNGGTGTTLTLGDVWAVGSNSALVIDYSSANAGTREVRTANATTGVVLADGIYQRVLVKDSAGVVGFGTRAAGSNQAITRYADETLATTLTSAIPTSGTVNYSTRSSGASLTMTDVTRSINSLVVDTSLNSLALNTGANVLSIDTAILFKGGNNATLSGAGINTGYIHQTGTGELTINNVLGGSGNVFAKTGTGTVVLGGNNTFTGSFGIQEGTVKLGAAGNGTHSPLSAVAGNTLVTRLGALDLNGITLSTAEPLALAGGTLTNSSTTGATFSGALSLTIGDSRIIASGGDINLTSGTATSIATGLTVGGTKNTSISSSLSGAAGRLTKQDSGTLTLSSSPTYTTTTTVSVNGGTLLLNGAVNIPTGGTLAVAAGGNFSVADGTVRNTTAATLTLATGSLLSFDWSSAGTVDNLAPAVAITPAASAAVGIIINPISGTPTGGGNLLTGVALSTLNNPNYFLANNTNFTATITKPGAGAGSVSIGSYAVVGTLANAYWNRNQVTGATDTMAFSSGSTSNWASDEAGTTANGVVPGGSGVNVIFGATGGATAGVTVGANMNLGSITFNDALNAVTISGNSLITLNNISDTAASTSGSLQAVTAGSAISVTSFANATNTISANLALGANQTWNVASGKTLVASGAVGGAFSLTKADAGTLTLSGTNTFTGATNVSAGTLQLDGSTHASSAVSISSTGTLAGTGTINGTLAVSGKLAPGDAGAVDIETLAAGATTWNGGSIWNFDLSSSGTTSDKLDITGNFTKGSAGTYQFDFMGSTPAWNTTFTLVDWSGTTDFVLGDFSFTNLGAGPYGTSSFGIVGSSLTFTAVPEPTSALAGLLLTAGLLRRRRK